VYRCEAWSLTLEEHRVLRKVPRSTREEVTEWSKLCNEELYDLYCHTKYVSGDQRMRWLGNVARTGEMRHAHRVLVGKLERKNHL